MKVRAASPERLPPDCAPACAFCGTSPRPVAAHLMRAVLATEAALRNLLQPLKMILASLGNLVPHVHWHVIPRCAGELGVPA